MGGLWARRFGKAEAYMSALARRHFCEAQPAIRQGTIIESVREAGLDVAGAKALLETDELKDAVWESYRSVTHDKGIHSIPLFVFNGPLTDSGPFRTGNGSPIVVHGSGDTNTFTDVFEGIWNDVQVAGRGTF